MQSQQTPATIYIDSRERPSGLADTLRTTALVSVQERWLPYGDLLIGDLLVERKTTSDLVASLLDGRLFRQMSGLLAFSTRRLLVVEGIGFPLDRGVSQSSIEGALIKIETGMQIPVLFTGNRDETEKLIVRVISQEQRAITRSLNQPTKQRKKDTCPQTRALRAIPSVSPKARIRLLERFRTLQNLFNSTCEELVLVEGVSRDAARDLLRFATERAYVDMSDSETAVGAKPR